jgi:hypothetical protein
LLYEGLESPPVYEPGTQETSGSSEDYVDTSIFSEDTSSIIFLGGGGKGTAPSGQEHTTEGHSSGFDTSKLYYYDGEGSSYSKNIYMPGSYKTTVIVYHGRVIASEYATEETPEEIPVSQGESASFRGYIPRKRGPASYKPSAFKFPDVFIKEKSKTKHIYTKGAKKTIITVYKGEPIVVYSYSQDGTKKTEKTIVRKGQKIIKVFTIGSTPQ